MLLFATVAVLNFICTSQAQRPDFVVSAPRSLHLGVETPIFVIVSGNQNLDLTVRLYDGSHSFFYKSGSFAPGITDSVRVNLTLSDMNPQEQKSPCDARLRLVVLSYHFGIRKESMLSVDCSGASFRIFTDKPIYTPKQTVKMTLASLNYRFQCYRLPFTVDIKNPQGVIVRRFSNLVQSNEIIPLTFPINAQPQLGNWAIEAYGVDNAGLNVTGNHTFIVREYVLPRFDVRILLPGYVTESTEFIDVDVESKYSYGEPVKGSAVLVFGVQFEDTYRPLYKRCLSPFQKQLSEGKAHFKISVADILNKLPYKLFPFGGRFRVTAYVTEAATGIEEKATDNTLVFSRKAFLLDVSRSRKYFKPGLDYHLEVMVHSPAGEPISKASVEIQAKVNVNGAIQPVLFTGKDNQKKKTDDHGLADFYISIPRLTKEVSIELTAENENTTYLKLLPESSTANRHIMISRKREKFPICFDKNNHRCRKEFSVISSHLESINICHFVTCGGQILGKNCRNVRIWPATITVDITPEMRSCCYLVVFYQKGGEVVADHAPIYTQEGYPNNVAVRVIKDRFEDTFEPGEKVSFGVTGLPNSVVFLTGVDKSVQFLLNDDQTVSESNSRVCFGEFCQCLAVGGRTSLEIFRNSGLGVTTRLAEAASSFQPLYVEEKASNLEKCCQMGKDFCIADNTANCIQRGKTLKSLNSYTDECAQSFVDCCNNAYAKGQCIEKDDNLLARSSKGNDDTQFAPVAIFRSDFPESWQKKIFLNGEGKATEMITLPDSITTWQIKVMGTSSTGLFGVAEPVDVKIFQPIFLDVILPYSVKKGEQFLVKAVVFNYNKNSEQNATVELVSSDSLCTSAGTGTETERVELTVPKRSSKAALFSVVPLKIGEARITLVLRSFYLSEQVSKNVRVEPEGVEKRIGETHAVNLEDDSKKKYTFNFTVPKDSVKNSASGQIFITGNLLSPIAVVTDLSTLIAQPYGCGEQNLFRLGPNIAVLQYLKHTNQLSPSLKRNSLAWIQEGYENQLNYRRKEPLSEKGSFSAFGDNDDHPGSTWLTAFAAKTLCQARNVDGINIDSTVIDDALKWLVTKQDQTTGEFRESGRIIHQEMKGGVEGSVCSLTAFSLISMLECSFYKSPLGLNTARRALSYLNSPNCLKNRQHCSGSYFKALVAHTYCLAGEYQSARNVVNELKECASVDNVRNMMHWTARSTTRSIAIETASYASLAYMCLKDYSTAEKIINWLTSVRTPEGGFVSTQDTILAIQALSLFAKKKFDTATNLKFTINAGGKKSQLTVVNANANVRNQFDVPVGGLVNVTVKGKGTALVQAGLRYHHLLLENTCAFAITVDTDWEKSKKTLELKLCLKHLKNNPTMMAVVEIELFSGFEAIDKSLKDLRNLSHIAIKRYESVGRVVKLYLEEITTTKTCFKFKAKREQKVGFVQPATVRVYDYYNPDDNCTKFYSPKKESPLLATLCFGKSCICGAGRCPACYSYQHDSNGGRKSPFDVGQPATCRNGDLQSNQKLEKLFIDKEELQRLTCALRTFAYKVKVLKTETFCDNGWTKIVVQLVEEIKKGMRDFDFKSNRKVKMAIWKRAACRCPKVEKDQEYLFVGNDGQKFVIDHNSIWMPWKKYLLPYTKSFRGGGAICELHVR